jgi:dihydrofolate synthase/folylpolyglutamate synthase
MSMRHLKNFYDVEQVLAPYRQTTPTGTLYSLDAIKRFMHFLSNPQDSLMVIHVAGTSGKTSTVYYIAALLQTTGYKVGMTVSPHVNTIADRAQIDGAPLSEKEYCAELTEFMALVDQFPEKLSYFELLVAFAYWEFARKKVDYAVVEVGLGGLLDGTNIVNSADKLSVITDIGLDHTEILGNTLGKISAQKAGIINPDSTVFIQRQTDEVLDVVRQIADTKNATFQIIEPPTQMLTSVALPPFQVRNFHLARAVWEYVAHANGTGKLSPQAIEQAARVHIPGRMELLSYRGNTLILDGSHNPQKMAALAEGIQTSFPNTRIPALVSFGTNKQADIADTLAQLRTISDEVILTTFSAGQDEIRAAINPRILLPMCRRLDFQQIDIQLDPEKAFCKLLAKNSDKLLVTGSYFLLEQVRPIVLQQAAVKE